MGKAGAVVGRRYRGRKGVREGEAGGDSVGLDPIEGNQKGAMRPALTIPNLNIPEGCFGA